MLKDVDYDVVLTIYQHVNSSWEDDVGRELSWCQNENWDETPAAPLTALFNGKHLCALHL